MKGSERFDIKNESRILAGMEAGLHASSSYKDMAKEAALTAEKGKEKDATRRFKGLLLRRGLTLRDVSDRIGISLSTLYRRLESDTFKMNEIKAISKSCSIPVEELVEALRV